ncbi:MAG: MaoC/PaaZ C-terminal domain-containing protein [Kangiellaceae bacterium]|nr:MaoC/PaaZ C-terminal domain-containing protein [Kangiellaceae bacterium]
MNHFLQANQSWLSLYWQALLKRDNLKGARSIELPSTDCRQSNFVINANHLAKFKLLCGYDATSPGIPPTYLQMMALPAQLTLIIRPEVPFAALGLVHQDNRVEVYTRLDESMQFDLNTRVTNCRATEKGWLFDIVTDVYSGQQLVMTATASILKRIKGLTVDPSHLASLPNLPGLREFAMGEPFGVESNIGRRYAVLSGDYNPIHMTALTAKLFGFNRAIAHGMWTKAMLIRQVVDDCYGPGFFVGHFKTPLELPGEVAIGRQLDAVDRWYCLINRKRNRPVMYFSAGQLG